MRTKTVTYGGREFRFASLKLSQVEALLQEETLSERDQWTAILDAIANAGGSGIREEFLQVLDRDDFRDLYCDVLLVSGLKRRDNLENVNHEPLDFNFVRCHLVHTLGWTFTQADDCAFADAMTMFEHWAEFPPQHVLMAGYVGYKSERRQDTSANEMAATVGKVGGIVHQSIDSLPLEMQGILAQGLGLFGEPKPDES